jgi:hypothetical protein
VLQEAVGKGDEELSQISPAPLFFSTPSPPLPTFSTFLGRLNQRSK